MITSFFGAIIPQGIISLTNNGSFTFTVNSPSRVSAGVYKTDGTLVKMLFNARDYGIGVYTEYWNGKDALNNTISSPDSTYNIQIAINDVQYTWEGTLGNTSDFQTGVAKHRGYFYCMRGLAFAGSYGYFAIGYTESGPAFAKFNILTPNQKIITTVSATTLTSDVNYVCTDGTRVYWGALDGNADDNSYVFGTLCSNDTYITFSSGVSYTPTFRTAINVIAKVTLANALITGMAVQQSSNFLFVTRSTQNSVQVLDKVTGALVRTLSFTTPRSICVDGNFVWLATGTNTVKKYTVNVDGTFTDTGISIASLINPLALSVSGSSLAIADSGSSQQVKFYNTTTGIISTTLGTANGYYDDATVSDDKFYFEDSKTVTMNPELLTFIAHQADGSFWVGDPGNSRVQHYDSSQVFINRIQSLGSSIYVWADKNNITRVWKNFLEFHIDYTEPLTGSTGWTLVKNWGANVTSAYDKSGIAYPTTLLNCKTYAFIRKGSDYEVVEFTPGATTLRFTGVIRTGLNYTLASDGSIEKFTSGAIGASSVLSRFTLTGFDGSNNPLWSPTATTLFTTPILTIDDANAFPRSNVLTSTNKFIMYDYHAAVTQVGNTITVGREGYHLQGGVIGSNVWQWKTELGTQLSYGGSFPEIGYFDIGNRVNDFAGGSVQISDRNIITTYHGEFWKNSQTNKYNHYLDNGLALGQFGITREETVEIANAKMAGNVSICALVKDYVSGNLYLYHGDESDHAALHRWKVSGLDTIAEQTINMAFPSGYTASPQNYLNLMTGLPRYSTLPASVAGWTRTPSAEEAGWNITTTNYVYDEFADSNIHVEFSTPSLAATDTLVRYLGDNFFASTWQLSGDIAWEGKDGGRSSIQVYFEILDAAGRIITSVYYNQNFTTSTNDVLGNSGILYSAPYVTSRAFTRYFKPLTITVNNGIISFSYNNQLPITRPIVDSLADWHSPTNLRIRCVANPAVGPTITSKSINIGNLKLY